MTEELRLPGLQPAHPSDKFTMEEARAALQRVKERQRLRELRECAEDARKLAQTRDGGEEDPLIARNGLRKEEQDD